MNNEDTTQDKSGKPCPKYTICRHCGYDMREEKVVRKIYMNGEWHNMKFCCLYRGGDFQMGCEG